PYPPYDILRTRLIDFKTMQRLRRFARYWDLVANSGNFVTTTRLIYKGSSPFWSFLICSDWLYERTGRTDSISLGRLMELVFEFLTLKLDLEARTVAAALQMDYERSGRRDMPKFLKVFYPAQMRSLPKRRKANSIPKRQARHLGKTRDMEYEYGSEN